MSLSDQIFVEQNFALLGEDLKILKEKKNDMQIVLNLN